VLMGSAILAAAIALVVSPLLRAICWDCLAHPTHTCVWVREGGQLRELKAGTDYPVEH
jgi:hypothetical protein